MPNYPYPTYQQPFGVTPQMMNSQSCAPQTYIPSQSQGNGIRTVYSEAEARAAQIPTDGNPVLFLDQNGEFIYTKKFSFETGAFPFETYKRVNPEHTPQVRYATIDDLNALRDELLKGKVSENV